MTDISGAITYRQSGVVHPDLQLTSHGFLRLLFRVFSERQDLFNDYIAWYSAKLLTNHFKVEINECGGDRSRISLTVQFDQ